MQLPDRKTDTDRLNARMQSFASASIVNSADPGTSRYDTFARLYT
jgi:hypothetical protein